MLTQRIHLLSLLAIPSTYAQFIHGHRGLGSCGDVDCPPLVSTGPEAGCAIVNRTYQTIGISTFPSDIAPEGEKLTWTLGVKARDILGESDRVVEKGFYLGTPPDLQLKPDNNRTLPFQGCAVILNTNRTTRPSRGSWACPDVVGEGCHVGLLQAISKHVQGRPKSNETTEQVCRSMMDSADLRPSACESPAGKDVKWTHMQAIPLTGPAAPSPPTESQNSSSTCHPTLPKSNDLTFVWAYNETGTVWAESTIPMVVGINLVMSVFWSPDGEVEGALNEPKTDMSCLWPVDDEGQTKASKTESKAQALEIKWGVKLLALVTGWPFLY